MTTHEVVLTGCTPEPLMSYLKALGIFRLVADDREHGDPNARACWRDGVFALRSRLTAGGLTRFFLEDYQPTPILVPWSGSDFFGVRPRGWKGPFGATPTATAVIEAFLATTSARLAAYRRAISAALSILDSCGIKKKKDMEDRSAKAEFISRLRGAADEAVVEWIDACAVLSDQKATFSALLGSGGGSDGNTHFSDNFMQNLWEALPDFSAQRKTAMGASDASLRGALFAEPCTDLVPKRTSSLFDAGAVGGPNAGQGFERVSLSNPWNVVLCLEGTLVLAGCVARRHGTSGPGGAAFPFQVRLTPTRGDSASEKEVAGREVWMPMWSHWASRVEMSTLFTEGRASLGGCQVERGVDFARAVATLGIDRGIDGFQRFAIVRGRVGGENYNTATALGHFEARARPDAELLREADGWLERFRRAAARGTLPRIGAALRAIESSTFEFCQHGGAARFGAILVALGRAERELAHAERFRQDKHLPPLAGLSPEWARAANDGSVEFELALSLAAVRDPERKVGPLRANLEPVTAGTDRRGRAFASWQSKDRSVVWNSADLPTNLAAVLARRLLDAGPKGCGSLPLASRHNASLAAVSRFLAGDADDEKLADLLWGLSLVDHSKSRTRVPRPGADEAPPVPRAYALLKLLFLAHPLQIGTGAVTVKPEPATLALARSGRVGDACGLAVRRLRAAGVAPMPGRAGRRVHGDAEWTDAASQVDARRLAAGLLFPVSRADVDRLMALVVRPARALATDVG